MSRCSTGLELILNAAEGVLQIAVTDNGALLCAQEWHKADRATEILAPALKEICAALGIRPTDFRRVACVRGPGSFTGIRLVLSTAAALRRVGRMQLAGLDYMQALAATAVLQARALYGAPVWALTHARRNMVHCQPFMSYGPQIPPQPTRPVDLCEPAEALERIMAGRAAPLPEGVLPGSRTLWVCGSGLARNAAVFAALDDAHDAGRAAGSNGTNAADSPTGTAAAAISGDAAARALPVVTLADVTSPGVAALCLLARHGDYFARDVAPLYVRPCDAVENLPLLAPRQGLTGEHAAAALQDMLRRAPCSEI